MVETSQVTYKRLSSVKSKNTKPEMIVRKFLHMNGYRFRLTIKDLPGQPDIVLKKSTLAGTIILYDNDTPTIKKILLDI